MALSFSIEADGDQTRFALQGDLTDEVDMAPLLGGLKPKSVLDMDGVKRINSAGIRHWVRFAHEVPADVNVQLERCPPWFLRQVTMIGNFLGRTRIRSISLPFVCTACDEETTVLTTTSDLGASAPSAGKCADCGGELELDEADDVYQAFLAELRR